MLTTILTTKTVCLRLLMSESVLLHRMEHRCQKPRKLLNFKAFRGFRYWYAGRDSNPRPTGS